MSATILSCVDTTTKKTRQLRGGQLCSVSSHRFGSGGCAAQCFRILRRQAQCIFPSSGVYQKGPQPMGGMFFKFSCIAILARFARLMKERVHGSVGPARPAIVKPLRANQSISIFTEFYKQCAYDLGMPRRAPALLQSVHGVPPAKTSSSDSSRHLFPCWMHGACFATLHIIAPQASVPESGEDAQAAIKPNVQKTSYSHLSFAHLSFRWKVWERLLKTFAVLSCTNVFISGKRCACGKTGNHSMVQLLSSCEFCMRCCNFARVLLLASHSVEHVGKFD